MNIEIFDWHYFRRVSKINIAVTFMWICEVYIKAIVPRQLLTSYTGRQIIKAVNMELRQTLYAGMEAIWCHLSTRKKTHCWLFKCHMATLLCDVIMVSATSFHEVDLKAELYILMVCIEKCNYVAVTSATQQRVCFTSVRLFACLFPSASLLATWKNMMNCRNNFR